MSKQLPTPTEIIAHLDRFVHGQTKAKRDLAVAAYNHYLGIGYRDHRSASDQPPDASHVDFGKQHVLLMGPTGSGKTYTIRLIAEVLGVPLSFAAATALVQTGYVGTRIEDMIESLYLRSGKDPYLAQRAIVFIDEIDKIRAHPRTAGPDVSGEGVQQALLSVLDGRPVTIGTGGNGQARIDIDTSGILFVCTGAFVGLAEIVRQRLRQRRSIGFSVGTEEIAVDELTDAEVLQHAETEDLVEFGFIPEFVGRFSTVSSVSELGEEDLIKILQHTEGSILPKQKKLFELHGIELVFTDEALRAVAVQARKLQTGARALDRIVLASLDDVDYRLPELASQGIRRIVLTEATIRGEAPPRLEGHPGPTAPAPPETLASRIRQRVLVRPPASAGEGADVGGDAGKLTKEQARRRLERVRETVGVDEATGSARQFWLSYEEQSDPRIVLRLVEELARRKATVTELFQAYVSSNTDNVQCNLHYLDYVRCKREWDRRSRKKKREQQD